jgi:hypothetical protein
MPVCMQDLPFVLASCGDIILFDKCCYSSFPLPRLNCETCCAVTNLLVVYDACLRVEGNHFEQMYI